MSSEPAAKRIKATSDEMPTYEEYVGITDWLKSKTTHRPDIFIVCGTGLGRLAELIESPDVFEYKDIPGFPVSTVEGHSGRLLFGKLRGKTIGCMQGRFHSYEGYPMWKVTLPVRVMSLMGAKVMIATNAAGGLNRAYKVGDIMIMHDHINFPGMAGRHPLVGPNIKEFGPRFNPMTTAYDRDLIKLSEACKAELKFDGFMHKGVYAMVSGPSYETPSECAMLATCGADVVGMSTAPEVTVAVHCGMRCMGFSLVTNISVLSLESDFQPNHEEVIEAGRQRALDMNKFIGLVVDKMELA